MEKALKLYYDDNKNYPGTSNAWYKNNLCTGDSSPLFSTLGLDNYIKPLPNDPKDNVYNKNPSGCYWYYVTNSKQGYLLLFHPEGIPVTGTAQRPYPGDMGCYVNGVGEVYYCVGENW